MLPLETLVQGTANEFTSIMFQTAAQLAVLWYQR